MTIFLKSLDALEQLPFYTPIRGMFGTVPILAHRSPNGMWWTTVKNPVRTSDLLRWCPLGFTLLREDDEQSQQDLSLALALQAVEVLEFFARYKPTNGEDQVDVHSAAKTLRKFLLESDMLEASQRSIEE